MSGLNPLASVLMASLLTVGMLAMAPVADAAPASQALLTRGENAKSNVVEIARRGRGRALHPTIGPNYLAYDYPYYYRRGFYPQHIGPGYIYYGYPYFRGKSYSSRCAYSQSGCGARSRHERGLRLKRGT